VNSTEAAKLLVHCAAFDNRQPSRAAAEAWAVALRDVPLDADTLDAVARYYGTPPKDPNQRLWIQPHDVRAHRRSIRSERAQGFVYEPPGEEEHPRRFLARYRAQLEAVASGSVPAPIGAPALTGGPHKDVAEKIAEIGRAVPEDDDSQRGVFGVRCPKCDAPIGRSCWTPARRRRSAPHPARARLAAGDPVSTPGVDAEATRRQDASRRFLAEQGDAS